MEEGFLRRRLTVYARARRENEGYLQGVYSKIDAKWTPPAIANSKELRGNSREMPADG